MILSWDSMGKMHINRCSSKGRWENILTGNLEYHGVYHGKHNLQKPIWVLFLFPEQAINSKNNSSPFLSHFLPYLLVAAPMLTLFLINCRMKGNAPSRGNEIRRCRSQHWQQLWKPFAFNCVPQSENRTFCLCATSNQEMKR